jgi:hypothetical protein
VPPKTTNLPPFPTDQYVKIAESFGGISLGKKGISHRNWATCKKIFYEKFGEYTYNVQD